MRLKFWMFLYRLADGISFYAWNRAEDLNTPEEYPMPESEIDYDSIPMDTMIVGEERMGMGVVLVRSASAPRADHYWTMTPDGIPPETYSQVKVGDAMYIKFQCGGYACNRLHCYYGKVERIEPGFIELGSIITFDYDDLHTMQYGAHMSRECKMGVTPGGDVKCYMDGDTVSFVISAPSTESLPN